MSYELLHNMYRPSLIQTHPKLCDLIYKSHIVTIVAHKAGVRCPFVPVSFSCLLSTSKAALHDHSRFEPHTVYYTQLSQRIIERNAYIFITLTAIILNWQNFNTQTCVWVDDANTEICVITERALLWCVLPMLWPLPCTVEETSVCNLVFLFCGHTNEHNCVVI